MKSEARIIVHQVVQAPRAHRPARRDRARDDPRRDEVDDRLGDDIRVDRELAPVAQASQHLVRHATEPT